MSGYRVPSTGTFNFKSSGGSGTAIVEVFGSGTNVLGFASAQYDDKTRPPPLTTGTIPTMSTTPAMSSFRDRAPFLPTPTPSISVPMDMTLNTTKVTAVISGNPVGSSNLFVIGTTQGASDILTTYTANTGAIATTIQLTSNTKYYITAYSSNANNVASLRYANPTAYVSTPPAPPAISALSGTTSNISFKLTGASGNATTGYSAVIGAAVGGTDYVASFAPSPTDSSTAITKNFTANAITNKFVYVTVYQSNAIGSTATSSSYTSSVAGAPTSVSASGVSASGLTPTWTNPEGDATIGYKIRIGTGSSGTALYNIVDGSAVTKDSTNAYTISSNVYIYVSVAVSNAIGIGSYGTGTTSYLTSAPSGAPTVTITGASLNTLTATLAHVGTENGSTGFQALYGTDTAANNITNGTAVTVSSGIAFPSGGFTSVGSNNLIYLKVASTNSKGAGSYSTAASFPSTVPPIPTVSSLSASGTSASASTISATLAVAGNAGASSYTVYVADSGGTVLQNYTPFTSGMSVTWGSNRADYVSFNAVNAAGTGAASTVYLANWTPSVSVTSSSAVQDGTSVSFVFADQPTTNGLTYTDIRLGTSAGASDIRTAQALTAGTQAGTQTFSISATARPYTVYITATATAGSTKTSTGSNSYTIQGYPLQALVGGLYVANLSGYSGTNTSVSYSSYTNVSVISTYLTVQVNKTDVYNVYSFKTSNYTVSSYPSSGGAYYTKTITNANNSLITAYGGGKIYVEYTVAPGTQTNTGVAIAVNTSTGNIPIGGTISIPDPIAVWPSATVTGGWRVHVFTSSGNFVPQMSGTGIYNIVVIGGGGGAGCGYNYHNGGGGGAGGVVIVSNAVLDNAGTYSITIGGGGAGSGNVGNVGGTGSNSIFTTGGSFVITAYGGSGGGSYNQLVANGTGSGGGGANNASVNRSGGAAGTAGTVVSAPSGSTSNFYTNAGGTGVANSEGGGGGGAAGAGGTSTADQFTTFGGGGAGATFFGTIYAAGGGAWGNVNGPGCGGTSGWSGGGGGYSGAVIIYYRI